MPAEETVDGVGEVTSNLLKELSAGLYGDVRDLHAPCFKVDDEEHEVADEPCAGEHLHGEEVGGSDGAEVGLQESVPRRLSIWSRIEAVLSQYASDRAASGLVAEGR